MKLSVKAQQLLEAFTTQLAKELADKQLNAACNEANTSIEDEIEYQLHQKGRARVSQKAINEAMDAACEYVVDDFDLDDVLDSMQAALFEKLEHRLKSKMKVEYVTRTYNVVKLDSVSYGLLPRGAR